MKSNPLKLFRTVLDETSDPLAAIRAVRDVFGLSVTEAKEVWVQATGRAGSLTERQEELAAALPKIVCPKCLSGTTVVRKMHCLPVGLGYSDGGSTQASNGAFVNGFWCSKCEVAFVPDHLLDELGLVAVRPV